MLVIRQVTKTFGEGERAYVALDGINLAIGNGEFVSLLGASGCGKTTLLNMLAGFEVASDGTISLNEKPLGKPGRQRVMFFQDAADALFPWLTVEENVEFGIRINGIPKNQSKALIDEHLEKVGLASHRHKFPAQLSGGMRQRLQIARGLAIDPEIMLMDEPFAALDALTRRRMHEQLLQIWAHTRKTVVFVTHDIAEAITLSDRIAVMTRGPRSKIARDIEVGFDRPREPGDPRFGRLFREIEDLLAHDLAESD